MIRGPIQTISGTLLEHSTIAPEAPTIYTTFELIEVLLEMNGSGLAEVELPVVSGFPALYSVRRMSAPYQPGQAFDLLITSRMGKLAGGLLPNIVNATGIVADITPTAASANNNFRMCGPLNIRILNSGAANAGKRVVVALSISAAVRAFTT